MYYRVNFTFVNPTGYLRASALVIDAKDAATAKRTALARLDGKHDMINVTSVHTYVTAVTKEREPAL